MPLLVLLLLFTLLPLGELALLLRTGERIGALPTLGIVFLTGVVGAALARWQGLRTLRRLQEELGRGGIPTAPLFDGAMILVAGCLLVTPGLITDTVGFLLLVPPVRALLARALRAYLGGRVQFTQVGGAPARPHDPDVIDAEVVSSRTVPEPHAEPTRDQDETPRAIPPG